MVHLICKEGSEGYYDIVLDLQIYSDVYVTKGGHWESMDGLTLRGRGRHKHLFLKQYFLKEWLTV